MSCFTELRSRLLRQAAGLNSFHDSQTCARALLECLGPAVELAWEPGTTPRCVPRPDGGSRLVLPPFPDEQVEGLMETHELAHATCHIPFPRPPLINPTRASLRELTFRDLWRQMRESEAGEFVLGVLLPAYLVQELRSEADCLEVLEVTGLDRETLQRRIEQVRGWDTALPGDPPSWSAWRHYRVEWVPSPVFPRLIAVPHQRTRPSIEFPVDPQDWRERRRSLVKELAALTPTEFSLKYRGEATPIAEDVTPHWWEFAGVPRRWKLGEA